MVYEKGEIQPEGSITGGYEMKQALRLSAVLVVAMVLSGLGIWAQTTSGAIQGRVTDVTGQPVIGAVVHVTGPSVQGFLGTATDTSGNYNIPFVPAGRGYEVKVSADGYGTVVRKGIDVPLGTTVQLPFTMSSGQTQVVVTTAAPIINMKSTSSGATLSSGMIESIPLARDSNQIAFLAPSAVSSGSSTPGNASLSGSTGAENQYMINGMNVTNTDLGISSNGSMGNGPNPNATMLNFDFIQDLQVLTGGLPPEYGGAMGGVVNAITRSGGNEYHGSLYAYYWNASTSAKGTTYNYNQNLTGNAGFTQYDVGGDLGGYFIKDKLWFYLGYDYNRFKDYTSLPVTSGDSFLSLNGQPAQSVFSGTQITDVNQINQQYAFKLTWNINPNQKLALSTFGNVDKEGRYAALNVLLPTAAAYTYKDEPNNLSLQWNSTWSPKFFSEVVLSYHNEHQWQTYDNAAANNNWVYSYLGAAQTYGGFRAYPKNQTDPTGYTFDPSTGVTDLLNGNFQPSLSDGGLNGVAKDKSEQANVKLTNLFTWHGQHELSYGFQYDNRDYTPVFGNSGPTNFISPTPGPQFGQPAIGGLFIQWAPAAYLGLPTGPAGQQFVYIAQTYYSPMLRPSTTRKEALWINDNWSLTDYFTLKMGVRYSQQYIAGLVPGAESLTLRGNYDPRIGFTWDAAHNGKSKLYGFFGRYTEDMPTDMAVRSLNNEVSGFQYFYNPNLTSYIPGPSVILGGTGEDVQGQTPGMPVSTRIKSPATDEWILGYDYQVAPDFRLGTRLVYRQLVRTIEDFSFNGAQTYIIGNPDKWTGIPVPGLNPNFTPNYSQTYYFPKPTRRYTALEITADKRMSNNWQMGGSYVLSRLEGNYEGLSSNDTLSGQLDPGINATYDLPQFLVNGFGLLPLDRTHVLKAYGSYTVPNIPLTFSANFQLQSGTPVSKYILLDWYGGGVGFYNQRGSDGRTPTTWTLDMAAQYNFKLWKSNLGLRIDIFNVTNNQKPLVLNEYYAHQASAGGPIEVYNPATSLFKKPWVAQAPRYLRVGIRWTF